VELQAILVLTICSGLGIHSCISLFS